MDNRTMVASAEVESNSLEGVIGNRFSNIHCDLAAEGYFFSSIFFANIVNRYFVIVGDFLDDLVNRYGGFSTLKAFMKYVVDQLHGDIGLCDRGIGEQADYDSFKFPDI